MIQMELREIHISSVSPYHIVVLEERSGDRAFEIYIGQAEAKAADDAVFQRRAPRPLTHDLILNVLEGMGCELEGIMIDSLDQDTFHGKLLLRTADGKHIKIDSRPSDAIVLATKASAPIFVSEDVLDKIDRGREEGDADEDTTGDDIDNEHDE